jgi:transposase-like protein
VFVRSGAPPTRLRGAWTCLYRAVDSTGETIDFMLSPKRDAVAAKYFLQMAMWRTGQIRPRAINVDGHTSYPPAIAELKASGELSHRCQCRPCPFLNNVLEQDHRFVKKRIRRQPLVPFRGGCVANHRRIRGDEWLAKGDVVGQVRFIEHAFGIAA